MGAGAAGALGGVGALGAAGAAGAAGAWGACGAAGAAGAPGVAGALGGVGAAGAAGAEGAGAAGAEGAGAGADAAGVWVVFGVVEVGASASGTGSVDSAAFWWRTGVARKALGWGSGRVPDSSREMELRSITATSLTFVVGAES